MALSLKRFPTPGMQGLYGQGKSGEKCPFDLDQEVLGKDLQRLRIRKEKAFSSLLNAIPSRGGSSGGWGAMAPINGSTSYSKQLS